MRKNLFICMIALTAVLCVASCAKEEQGTKVPDAPETNISDGENDADSSNVSPEDDIRALTPKPTDTPMPTPTDTPTSKPTETPIPTPTDTPTPTPTDTPTPTPTHLPLLKGLSEDYPCYVWVNCANCSLRTTGGAVAYDANGKKLVMYNGTKLYCTGTKTLKNASGYNVKYYCVEYDGGQYLISCDWTTKHTMFEYDFSDMGIVDPDDTAYSYDDMEKDIIELAKTYPESFSYRSAGQTADKREIYVCTIGNPDAEKAIYLCAGTHGREYASTHLLMLQAEYALRYMKEGFYEGIYFDDLFNEICYVIEPMVNPDGNIIAIDGPEGIRDTELRAGIEKIYNSDLAASGILEPFERNRETYFMRWKANALGEDPNRSFPFGWETTEATEAPSRDNYKGSGPFEFFEAIVQRDLIMELMGSKDLVFAVSYHATGFNLSWNVGQTGSFWKECVNAVDKLVYYTGYSRDMNNIELDDPVPLAGFTDWLNGEQLVPSVTIEIYTLGTPISYGRSSGRDPQILEPWYENREVWQVIGSLYYEGPKY